MREEKTFFGTWNVLVATAALAFVAFFIYTSEQHAFPRQSGQVLGITTVVTIDGTTRTINEIGVVEDTTQERTTADETTTDGSQKTSSPEAADQATGETNAIAEDTTTTQEPAQENESTNTSKQTNQTPDNNEPAEQNGSATPHTTIDDTKSEEEHAVNGHDELKTIIWNDLGLRSIISIHTPRDVIEEARVSCVATLPRDAVFPNPADFTQPETAGIPRCVRTTEDSKNNDEVIIAPIREGVVQGIVRTAAGTPATQVVVNAGNPLLKIFTTATTNENGFFTFSLVQGTWLIGIPSTDGAFDTTTATQEVTVSDKPITLSFEVAQRDAQLFGTIVDTNGTVANGFAGVAVIRNSSTQRTLPIVSGQFDLSAPIGTYEIKIVPADDSQWRITSQPEIVSLTSGITTIQATVTQSTASVRGKINTANGQTLSGHKLEVVAVREDDTRRDAPVVDGAFSLSLTSGVWVVRLVDHTETLTTPPSRTLRLAHGDEQTLTFSVIPATAEITGTVLRANGEPAVGTWVSAHGKQRTSLADERGVHTDTAGRYHLSLAPGNYQLQVFAPTSYDDRGTPEPQTIALEAGETRQVNFVFRKQAGAISGQVTADGQGVPSHISAWSTNGGFVETRSDASGIFTLTADAGHWRISASAKHNDAAWRSRPQEIILGAGETVRQSLDLVERKSLAVPISTAIDRAMKNVITNETGAGVTVPAGAFLTSRPTTLTLTPDPEVPTQANAQVVGGGYDVSAFDESGNALTQLAEAVTITLPYDSAELTARGLTPAALTLAFWDEATGIWRTLPTSVVNESAQTVSGTVDHLTRFAVVSAADVTPPSAPFNVSGTRTASTTIRLSWANPATDFSHAKIYRAANAGQLGTLIGNEVTSGIFTDTTAPADTTHYTVRAVDPAGNESTNVDAVVVAAHSEPTPAPDEPVGEPGPLARALAGRIVLQVEAHGEAWYVDPTEAQRHYLGRPADAFAVMRDRGLGITTNNLVTIAEPGAPFTTKDELKPHVSGRILLQVEANGEAWYVEPTTHRRYFLGRPADAFRVMREQGLGISNENLATIPIAATSARP